MVAYGKYYLNRTLSLVFKVLYLYEIFPNIFQTLYGKFISLLLWSQYQKRRLYSNSFISRLSTQRVDNLDSFVYDKKFGFSTCCEIEAQKAMFYLQQQEKK